MTVRRAAVALLVIGCGGTTPAPTPIDTPTYDPAPLAERLHRDLEALASTTRRTTGDCAAMETALRALIPGMTANVDAAKRDAQDPERAEALTAALRSYDARAAVIADAAFADLATCKGDDAVREVVRALPTL